MRPIIAACAMALVTVSPVRATNPAQETPAPPTITDAEAAAAAEEAEMRAAAAVVQRSIDAWRARNFDGWIGCFAPDVMVTVGGLKLDGRAALAKTYRPAFQTRMPDPKIVESGWTGYRIYVIQDEYLPGGAYALTSYTEYEVQGGKIITVESYVY